MTTGNSRSKVPCSFIGVNFREAFIQIMVIYISIVDVPISFFYII